MKEKEVDLCLVARTSHQYGNVLKRHGQHRPANPVLLLASSQLSSTTIEFRCADFLHTTGSMMDLRQRIACLALACSVALVHAQFPLDSPEGLTQVGRFDEAPVLFEKVPPTILVHCHTF